MKIGIEAQRIFRPNKHGMDFVALETIRELQKIDKENEYFIFVSPGEDRCLQESPNLRIIEIKYPTYPLWEQIGLPFALNKIKPDVLHCTSNTAPLYCSVPLILTLHDIIFLENRNQSNQSLYQEMGRYYRRLVVPRILSMCKKIITVSHFERDRICNALHLSKEKVVTVYNGYNSHFRIMSESSITLNKYTPFTNFFLFLGNTDPKKNTRNVLKAYSIYLKLSKKKRTLLIADLKEEYIESIVKEENIKEIKEYLCFPGYIQNKDLPSIFNGAFAFLYPSLRESFGIPILESMACGTPVITSNISAMPEIAGNAALLTDPTNSNDISEKMLQIEQDKGLYEQLISSGLEHIKLFSWRKSAEELLKIYKSFEI